jgi:SAM-dependent methyltransferase
MAGRAIHGLRRLRALALRALSPLERLADSRVRDRDLPPLWLRRHAGAPSAFESSAAQTIERLRALGLLGADRSVLDLGCGPGGMARALGAHLGERGSYLGLDVHGPSLDWCAETWSADPRFRFGHLREPRSPYFAAARRTPAMTLDGLGGFDLVLAKSLATHLLPLELARLLRRIARALAPDGRLLATAFLFDPAARPATPAFAHRSRRGRVRWRRRGHPRAAIAYERGLFLGILEGSGLTEVAFVPGFFPGEVPVPTGQDTIVAARRP